MSRTDEIHRQLDALGEEAIDLLRAGNGTPRDPERYETIVGTLRRAQQREKHAAQVIQRIEAVAKAPRESSEMHRVAESALEYLAGAQEDVRALLAVAHRLGDQYLIGELNSANNTLKRTITAINHVKRRVAAR